MKKIIEVIVNGIKFVGEIFIQKNTGTKTIKSHCPSSHEDRTSTIKTHSVITKTDGKQYERFDDLVSDKEIEQTADKAEINLKKHLNFLGQPKEKTFADRLKDKGYK